MKFLKFRIKNVLFKCFVLEFENSIVIFEISAFECITAKFCVKNKILKYGTKMSYLANFGQEF